MKKLQIKIPILLPEVADEKDQCVQIFCVHNFIIPDLYLQEHFKKLEMILSPSGFLII